MSANIYNLDDKQPITSNTFKIPNAQPLKPIKRADCSKQIDSTKAAINALEMACFQETTKRGLTGESASKMKLNIIDLAKLFVSNIPCVARPVNTFGVDDENAYKRIIYVYNFDNNTYVSSVDYFKQLVQELLPYSSVKTINDLVKQLYDYLTTTRRIEFETIYDPPKHIIRLGNGYYDWKKHKFVPFDDEHVSDYAKYHYTSYVNWDYCEPDKESLSVIETVFNDWSKGNADNLKFLLEMVQASIKGDGMGKSITIMSDGGDGKSTFMAMIMTLIGNESVHEANYHDLDDDNSFNTISSSTKLIYGDDLATRFNMYGKRLSRFKGLVDNKALQFKVKYLSNVLIKTTALWIQLTNSDISFYENNAAILRRLIVYVWPSMAYYKNSTHDFKLDDYVYPTSQNQIKFKKFYETFLYYVLTKSKYVTQFSQTESMKSDTKTMVASTDIIERFVEMLIDHNMLDNYIIPKPLLFSVFKLWTKECGEPSTMTQGTFTSRITKVLAKYDFTDKTPQTKINMDKLTNLDFNKNDINGWSLYMENIPQSQLTGRQRYFYNEKNQIPKEMVLTVSNDLYGQDIDDTTVQRILAYLAYNQLDSEAQALLGV